MAESVISSASSISEESGGNEARQRTASRANTMEISFDLDEEMGLIDSSFLTSDNMEEEEVEKSLFTPRIVFEVYLLFVWDFFILLVTLVCCAYTLYVTITINNMVPVVTTPFNQDLLEIAGTTDIDFSQATILTPCTYPVTRYLPSPQDFLNGTMRMCPLMPIYTCPENYSCLSDSIGHPSYTTCASDSIICDYEVCHSLISNYQPLDDDWSVLLIEFVGPGFSDNLKYVMATLFSVLGTLACFIRVILVTRGHDLDSTVVKRLGKVAFGFYFIQLFTRLAVYISLAVEVQPQDNLEAIIHGHCFDDVSVFLLMRVFVILTNILLIPSAVEFSLVFLGLFYIIFNHWWSGGAGLKINLVPTDSTTSISLERGTTT